MKTLHLIASLLLAATVAIGADAPDNAPHSTAAKSAIIKADRAKVQAEAAYKRAMSDIYRKLVLELADARTAVMRDGGRDALAEATRIQAAIDAANEEMATVDGRATLTVISALWGAGDRVTDVSKRVAAMVDSGVPFRATPTFAL